VQTERVTRALRDTVILSETMAVPTIAPKTTKKISTELLDFDPENPRLMEDGTRNASEEQIISALAETADLSEVVESIVANGYFDIEPLIDSE
jgi:hypothetical protein